MNETLIFRVGMSPTESNKKIGPIRAHLYNYAFAKSEALKGNNAKVIYRVDDTNGKKHQTGNSSAIFEFFSEFLGFDFDINPGNSWDKIGMSVIQSERQKIYLAHLEGLCDKGMVFVEKESGLMLFDICKFAETYTNILEVEDLLKGKYVVRLEEKLKQGIRFFPVLRSNKEALYHLASVIDDWDFGVTHVVRGVDKLSIVEYQEMLRISLGFRPKKYLHTPMLFDENGGIARTGVKFDDFLKMGISARAIISYLISSGYGNPDVVYSSIDDLISEFDYRKIHISCGRFDLKKMKSINRKIIDKISPDDYIESLVLYLCKTDHEQFAKMLNDDNDLKEFLVVMRRSYEEGSNILRCIINPEYIKPDMIDSRIISSIFNNKEEIFLKSQINPSVYGFNEKEFFDALRWILVGRPSFPSINKVIDYLKTNNLLMDRVNVAKLKLRQQFEVHDKEGLL